MLQDFSHHSSIKSILFELFLLTTSLKITSRGLESLKRAESFSYCFEENFVHEENIRQNYLYSYIMFICPSRTTLRVIWHNNGGLTIIENKWTYTL